MPLDVKAEWEGLPLLAKILEIEPIYDTWNVSQETNLINNFILNEIKERNLKNTPESFKEILTEIEESLHISPNLNIYKRLDKLKTYVNIIKRQRKLSEQRERLTNDIARNI